ncbi:MAG: alpha/beta hydrolase, partial [Chloroflexi bacterium]|nr:alpha/beta hydrolase [Chloroflexota bacterium]
MENCRKYGIQPYSIAVIHGGPGAPGEMAPVARELAKLHGILEPLQTKTTIEELLQELKDVLEQKSSLPVTLIGYSWGAMLSFLFTARFPALVKKLVLVSSGVFEERYATNIFNTRLSRLPIEVKAEVYELLGKLDESATSNKNELFYELGKLISKADSYNPLQLKNEIIECHYEAYESIWKEARKLRISGDLLFAGKEITCPVTAIHGDYDPHPSEGIEKPLSQLLPQFKFILLKKCGHCPWIEKEAKDQFFTLIQME